SLATSLMDTLTGSGSEGVHLWLLQSCLWAHEAQGGSGDDDEDAPKRHSGKEASSLSVSITHGAEME
ncbi:Hypothetical predicted protein, partial [Marmota monax]